MKRKFNPKTIRLIIGLGNPGTTYEYTYHNAGQYIIDHIAKDGAHFRAPRQSAPFRAEKRDSSYLIKPTVFMNESGKAVRATLTYYKMRVPSLLVIHDDADILFGEYKISFGSRSAGHHGIDSIIENIGTDQFWRIRIGVRPEKLFNTRKRIQAGDFVLKKMGRQERDILIATATDIENLIFPTTD